MAEVLTASRRLGGAGQAMYRAMQWLLPLYGACVLLALLVESRFFLPAEDAVILWAYSRNLALHGVISYAAGGPRVEGATDFAWMVCVAAAIRCGLDPFLFTGVVNVLCLAGLAVYLLRLAGERVTAWRVLLIAGAAGCTPQIFAAASGFATLPDALLLTATVFYATQRSVWQAAATACVFCLFRPDGVVFAVPLLVTLLWTSADRRRDAGRILTAFVLPGAAYFLWRAWYFQELLPLPFYVKADAHRVLHTVVTGSVRTSLVFLIFAVLVIATVRKVAPQFRQNRSLILSLVVVPTLFYWCMRLDQNVAFRFYFYLPLAAAMVLACHWKALRVRANFVSGAVCLPWLLLLAMPLRRELRTFLDLQSPQLRDIALQLQTIPQHGTLLSSEAGILPYYSGWTAVDPWGLNTPAFAHRFFQPSDVESLAPDLIHMHPDAGESCDAQPGWATPYERRSWQALTRNIAAGASPALYELWQTSYGSEVYRRRKHWGYGQGDVSCWFVRRGTVHQAAIEHVLATHHGVSMLH
ncbi:MAG: hypothetical protein ACRYF4_08480 [Janthinobacterium lividum]